MKRKVLGLVLGVVAWLGLSVGTAFAWTYSLSGMGACQPDGSFKITWKVDNSTETEKLEITDSSNPSVVPVGTEVSANQSSNFVQNAAGTAPATFNLTLKGHWQTDKNIQTQTAKVVLKDACQQPAPPPTGGRGGDTTTTVTTVSTPPAPVQVQPPAGPVHAGMGGSAQTSSVMTVGLTGSLILFAAALRRLHEE